MDFWILGAAASAGYIAQQLKNLNRAKHNLSETSKIHEKSCPLRRVLSRKSYEDENHRIIGQACEDDSYEETASTSGIKDENLENSDNFSIGIPISNSNLAGSELDEINSDSSPQPTKEMGFSYHFRRNRHRLRSRRIKSQFMKPRTSLESCLLAQLHQEHAEIEEFICSVDRRSRSNLVSDRGRIDGGDFFSRAEGSNSRKNPKSNNVIGVPRLPDVVPFESQKKSNATVRNPGLTRSNSSQLVDENCNNAQGSSFDGARLFYIGLTMGTLSSFLENKRKTENLNNLLKQSENLVQDLQEELEMKDSLTVKELSVEDYGSRNGSSFVNNLSLEQNPSGYCEEEYFDKKGDESLSKIEAELEAELERLESNVKSSSLEGKLSKIAEVNPDFLDRESRADLFYGKSGTPLPSVQYPVSPRELSLRLHEVIQSRLENRVMELETEIQNSRKREFKKCNKTVTSSIHHNIAKDEQESADEAYGDFTKVSESDEENNQETENFQETRFNGGMEEDSFYSKDDVLCTSRDDSEDSDDEMERLLIQQIVEKARQGSPVVLKAQRALLSNDKN